jgi:hypothetical protein
MTRLVASFVALWILPVIGGMAWLMLRDDGPEPLPKWRAAGDLVKNQQLVEGDIIGSNKMHLLAKLPKKDTLIGKYLLVDRKKGANIDPPDVSSHPLFEPAESGSGVWLYALKDDQQLAEGVRIGAWVTVCSVQPGGDPKSPTTDCAKGPLSVEAVHRSAKNDGSTWVAFRVPTCRIADVGKYVSHEKRFLLAAANPPPAHQQACPTEPPVEKIKADPSHRRNVGQTVCRKRAVHRPHQARPCRRLGAR